MKSKESKKQSNLKLDKIADELLGELAERPGEILKKRFGLNGEAPMVLDKIGKEFGVTRERIRQIESDSFKKLKKAEKSNAFNSLIERAVAIIESSGDFCEKRILKEKLKKDVTQKERNQLMFILNSSSKLQFKKGNLKLNGFWFLAESKIDKKVIQSHRFVVEYLKETKEPRTFEDILTHLTDSEWKDFFNGEDGENRLRMILKASRLIDKNILEEWGLNNWKVISQRGSREKAYLVLRKHGEPLHFRKITNKINDNWSDKEALPQTVHNELIKDGRFVLVGRGIYGLTDWGYPEGTVKDVILLFMKEQGDPVEKETIISYVLSKKQVKEATILVTLANREVFDKNKEGMFLLK